MKKLRRRGQALLLVMWAMFIMTFAILGLIKLLNITIGTASAMERVAIASSLAFAGTTMGRNPDFPTTGKAETQKFPDGSELVVSAVSENSKLNINALLAKDDRETLRSLLRIWRLTDTEADVVLDCLFDYVEPGNTRRLSGAKAEQYRRAGRPAPPGRPFHSVNEMTAVLNFDLVTKHKENWHEYFTIYGDGSLDLATAPADLIRAVCRVGDAGAQSLVNRRSQGDGSPLDLSTARHLMGLTEKEFEGLSGQLAVNGKVRRVRSEAKFAQGRRIVEAVYQMDGSNTALLEWKEW